MKIFSNIILISIFCISGCAFNVENAVYSDDEDPFVPLSDVAEIIGAFNNVGVADHNFDHHMPTNSLWYFITRKKTACRQEAIVEINVTKGDQLSLRLKTDTTVLDEVILNSPKDYVLKSGKIHLDAESGSSSDGFGAGVGTANFYLYLTKDGDLAGEISGYSIGLLFYFIPAGGVGKEWNKWEKIAQPFATPDPQTARAR